MDQMNVGQQVAAETLAGAMAGERSFKEIRYPASGDFETELINLVNVFVASGQPGFGPHVAFSHERIASVFDYLAKRFRDAGKEIESQRTTAPFPGGYLEDQLRKIEAQRGEMDKKYALGASMLAASPPPHQTANEIRGLDQIARDEMAEKMLSHLRKTTIR